MNKDDLMIFNLRSLSRILFMLASSPMISVPSDCMCAAVSRTVLSSIREPVSWV